MSLTKMSMSFAEDVSRIGKMRTECMTEKQSRAIARSVVYAVSANIGCIVAKLTHESLSVV